MKKSKTRFMSLLSLLVFWGYIMIFTHVDVDANSNGTFYKDVNKDHWATTSISWATNNQIINGYSDGRFGPNDLATEAHFIAILGRWSGHTLPNITVKQHWADDSYIYLNHFNIPTKGIENIKQRNNPITRGDVAKILSAYMGEDLSVEHAVKSLYDKNISTGKTGAGTFEDYGPRDNLTRAQLVTFLHRVDQEGYKNLIGLTNPHSGSDNNKYTLSKDFLNNTNSPTNPKENQNGMNEDEKSTKGITEKQMPSSAYIETIHLLHSGSLQYWNWSKTDQNYINGFSSFLSNSQKNTLIEEMKQIETELQKWENRVIQVNGFEYYPSSVIGGIDALSRALSARYNLVFDNMKKEYPKPLTEIPIFSPNYHGVEPPSHLKDIRWESDEIIYKSLKDYSFNKDFSKGLIIVNTPYHFNVGGVVGSVKSSAESIFLDAHAYRFADTFYHELGHIWDFVYGASSNNYAQYLTTRGQNGFKGHTAAWGERTMENFAEDFRYVISPYSDKESVKTSFGIPTAEIQNKLLNYYKTAEKNTSVQNANFNRLNNKNIMRSTFVTDRKDISLSFYRSQFNSHNVDFVVEGAVPRQTFDSKRMSKSTQSNYQFSNEGNYNLLVTNYGMQLNFVYMTKPLFNSNEPTNQNRGNLNWSEITFGDLPVDAQPMQGDALGHEGIYAYRSDRHFILMIQNDQYNSSSPKFDINEIKVENNQLVISLKSGSKSEMFVNISPEHRNLPIRVTGMNHIPIR